MSLIDKDKTVSAIATYLFVNDAIKGPEPRRVVDYETFARSMLKDVPEVDAIPRDYYEKVVSEMAKRNVEASDIVRCKECYMCDEEMWCSLYDSIMESDDYCSYGERKEGER